MPWKYHFDFQEKWNSALAHLCVAQTDSKLSLVSIFLYLYVTTENLTGYVAAQNEDAISQISL